MTRPAAWAVVALALTAASAAADGGLTYTPPPPPSPPDLGGLAWRLAALTAALFAACGFVLWVARRGRPPHTSPSPTGRIRRTEGVTLGGPYGLHLFLVDGQTVAVATDATGLRSITVLSDPFDATLLDDGPAAAPSQSRL